MTKNSRCNVGTCGPVRIPVPCFVSLSLLTRLRSLIIISVLQVDKLVFSSLRSSAKKGPLKQMLFMVVFVLKEFRRWASSVLTRFRTVHDLLHVSRLA